ncbi:ABC transporter permease subunit [Streptomyces sp. G-G2]|uniref:ABC transporter permease subunit n=1 Tax=Streptomyces sp. G-G2 TaxID=3046201 RepID=UPI0024BBAC68|nr:ABC transporter permease subunit [Streptomyces sp. G-G2]MDJ0379389.1 ABC transporter permease subunit [Streptomyces sp. G-G2]
MTPPTSTPAGPPTRTPRPGATGTTAPLPTPRPHLGHAVASEWTKLISVRSTLWTIGSLVVTVVGIGLGVIVQTSDVNYERMPFTGPALFGLLAGQLAVIVLGVLTITSEYGTGLIRTTFGAAPDRHRVLTAKYLVFGAVAFLTVAGSIFLVGITTAIVHGGPAAGAHSNSDWGSALLASSYVTLLGVLSLAVGALVRHSAGAIAVMLGIVTLPPVIGGMLSIWEASQPLGRAVLEYNAPVALMELFGMPSNSGMGDLPSKMAQLGLLVLLTGAAVAGSYVVVGRRDV